jgi:hypothetical protein
LAAGQATSKPFEDGPALALCLIRRMRIEHRGRACLPYETAGHDVS